MSTLGKSVRQLIDQIEALSGWTVELRRAGHYRVVSPAGGKFFLAASPSDHRAMRNARALLRRAGATL